MIPGGFKFIQPETNFTTRPFASFQSIVNAVCIHRRGNKALLDKGLATEPSAVADEVEAFQVRLCEANGWTNYISVTGGGAGVPFLQSQNPSDQKQLAHAAGVARKLWSGIKTLNDWLDSGESPVPQAQAESRAKTCVACPLNGVGDLTSWFTKPAAGAIHRQQERMYGRNISTSLDGQLGVCSACLCPMKLKVQTPWKFIKPHLTPEVLAELGKGRDCWQLAENTPKL